MRHADAAMYDAKQKGKGRYEYYGASTRGKHYETWQLMALEDKLNGVLHELRTAP